MAFKIPQRTSSARLPGTLGIQAPSGAGQQAIAQGLADVGTVFAERAKRIEEEDRGRKVVSFETDLIKRTNNENLNNWSRIEGEEALNRETGRLAASQIFFDNIANEINDSGEDEATKQLMREKLAARNRQWNTTISKDLVNVRKDTRDKAAFGVIEVARDLPVTEYQDLISGTISNNIDLLYPDNPEAAQLTHAEAIKAFYDQQARFDPESARGLFEADKENLENLLGSELVDIDKAIATGESALATDKKVKEKAAKDALKKEQESTARGFITNILTGNPVPTMDIVSSNLPDEGAISRANIIGMQERSVKEKANVTDWELYASISDDLQNGVEVDIVSKVGDGIGNNIAKGLLDRQSKKELTSAEKNAYASLARLRKDGFFGDDVNTNEIFYAQNVAALDEWFSDPENEGKDVIEEFLTPLLEPQKQNRVRSKINSILNNFNPFGNQRENITTSTGTISTNTRLQQKNSFGLRDPQVEPSLRRPEKDQQAIKILRDKGLVVNEQTIKQVADQL